MIRVLGNLTVKIYLFKKKSKKQFQNKQKFEQGQTSTKGGVGACIFIYMLLAGQVQDNKPPEAWGQREPKIQLGLGK